MQAWQTPTFYSAVRIRDRNNAAKNKTALMTEIHFPISNPGGAYSTRR
jgi:hypothetical protein